MIVVISTGNGIQSNENKIEEKKTQLPDELHRDGRRVNVLQELNVHKVGHDADETHLIPIPEQMTPTL